MQPENHAGRGGMLQVRAGNTPWMRWQCRS